MTKCMYVLRATVELENILDYFLDNGAEFSGR